MRLRAWAGCFVALSLAAGAAAADDAVTLGTRETGMAWRDKLQSLIAEEGIEAAIAALQDPQSRFAQADPHIVIHRVTADDRVIVEGHSVFQEIAGFDMTDREDLDGRLFIRRFLAAVRAGGGARPTRHAIPKTGQAYASLCYNEWAAGHRGDYFITVCYDDPERP